jgi:hypothetical protein
VPCGATVVGFAVNVSVGAGRAGGGDTVTIAVDAVPPVPVQVNVNQGRQRAVLRMYLCCRSSPDASSSLRVEFTSTSTGLIGTVVGFDASDRGGCPPPSGGSAVAARTATTARGQDTHPTRSATGLVGTSRRSAELEHAKRQALASPLESVSQMFHAIRRAETRPLHCYIR